MLHIVSNPMEVTEMYAKIESIIETTIEAIKTAIEILIILFFCLMVILI
jgi:hypothetical protein